MNIKDLQSLESSSKLLDPAHNVSSLWFQQMLEHGNSFLKSNRDTKVYHEDPTATLMLDDMAITEDGKDLLQLLAVLHQTVDRVGINPASPGHMGYIPGGGVISSAMGDFLAAISNRYAGIFYANPGAAHIEYLMVKWMTELVGYPENAIGNLSSGGSLATLTAITTARDKHHITPEKIRKTTIYLTRQVHHCILKALRIAGLNDAIIREVPMTENYVMDIDILKSMIELDTNNHLIPFLIVGSAGSTDLGIVDPLNEMADIAAKHDCWFHVDAAYGGFFLLVESAKPIFKGIEKSDSVVLDPHKGLFLAYGTGAVIIKNREAVLQSHHYEANYMQDSYGYDEQYSPADFSPELTRHFRGLRMWLSLQLFGVKPFRAALEEKLLLTHYFYRKVQGIGFVTGPNPMLSVCLFRLQNDPADNANDLNRALVQVIQLEGKIFLSSTTIDDVFWLRVCILGFRTHKKEVDLLLQRLEYHKASLTQ